jgi:hypothetical protein
MASPISQPFLASPTLPYELGTRRWIPLSTLIGPYHRHPICPLEALEVHWNWHQIKGLGIALLISAAAWTGIVFSVSALVN